MGFIGRQLIRSAKAAACAVCIMLMVSGCGQADITKSDTTAIYVRRDGSIISTIVEDFSRDYYDLDEMKSQINEEIATYNSRYGQDLITLQDTVMEEDKVRVTMTYQDAATYAEFNDVTMFVGTSQDASAAGYSVTENGISPDGSDVTIDTGDEQVVIITSEKLKVMTSDKISCAPKGSIYAGSKSVDLSAVQGDTSVIILSK